MAYIPGAPSNIPANQKAAEDDKERVETTSNDIASQAKPGFFKKALDKGKEVGKKILDTSKEVGKKMLEQQEANAAEAVSGHTTGGGTIDTNAEVLKDTDKGKKLVEAETKDLKNPELGMGEQSEETKAALNEIEPMKEEEKNEPQSQSTNISSEEEAAEADSIANEMGIDSENEDPDTAKQQGQDLIEEMKKKGLITIEDGKIKFAELDTGMKPVVMKALTALSIAAAVASGGAIPPINFGKLTGTDEDVAMKREQYTNMMNQYGQALGSVMAKQDTARGISEGEAEDIGKKESIMAGDKYRDKLSTDTALQLNEQQFEHELKMLKQGHVNQKDIATLLYEQGIHKDADRLAYMFENPEFRKLAKDPEFRNAMARMVKAESGVTSADDFLNKLDKGVGTVANAASVVKP